MVSLFEIINISCTLFTQPLYNLFSNTPLILLTLSTLRFIHFFKSAMVPIRFSPSRRRTTISVISRSSVSWWWLEALRNSNKYSYTTSPSIPFSVARSFTVATCAIISCRMSSYYVQNVPVVPPSLAIQNANESVFLSYLICFLIYILYGRK